MLTRREHLGKFVRGFVIALGTFAIGMLMGSVFDYPAVREGLLLAASALAGYVTAVFSEKKRHRRIEGER